MDQQAQPPVTENVLITVVGQDRVGIIARVATTLSENGINILDLDQKILQGYFVMMLMADIAHAKIDLEALARLINAIGDEMGLKIMVQHENIFKSMHRV